MSYKFQRSLEAATDQTLVEPNWEGILECVDMIRGGEVPVKEALKAIQKRYHNPNPHIGHHALLILEACVKNCGKKFTREIATKEFMDDMKNLVISNPPEKIRDKILELIQCWTSAFKGISEYKIVEDTHALLKMNGFDFPPIDEAKAMFLADSAPDWAEGDNCYRCRVEFGVFTRKHHCRACGQIFCDRCSNKQMLLPQFGIEKKVRVCEACFDKSQSQPSAKVKSMSEGDDKSAAEAEAREKARKDAEAKEQEELQLALAISQSEAEAKEREKWSGLYSHYNIGDGAATIGTTPTAVPESSYWGSAQQPWAENNSNKQMESIAQPPKREELKLNGMGDDPQEQPFDSMLAKYLDRDYWERKRRETEEERIKATAPPPSEISLSVSSSVSQQQQPCVPNIKKRDNSKADVINPLSYVPSHSDSTLENSNSSKLLQQQQPALDDLASLYATMDITSPAVADPATPTREFEEMEGDEAVAETSAFCRVLKERVDTMSTRMRSNQLRGRSIVNDSAIHSLFSQLTDAHAQVLERMTKLEGQREHFERLQDHLAHIGEARQAVNALREETQRQRQEFLREEQNRRQAQLRQKLELMRHKKHEMLLNERQLAIQRFQQNERQILQQRLLHQQSPQTVGTVVQDSTPVAQQHVTPSPLQPPPPVVMNSPASQLHQQQQVPQMTTAGQYWAGGGALDSVQQWPPYVAATHPTDPVLQQHQQHMNMAYHHHQQLVHQHHQQQQQHPLAMMTPQQPPNAYIPPAPMAQTVMAMGHPQQHYVPMPPPQTVNMPPQHPQFIVTSSTSAAQIGGAVPIPPPVLHHQQSYDQRGQTAPNVPEDLLISFD